MDPFTELLKEQADMIIDRVVAESLAYLKELQMKEERIEYEFKNIDWSSCQDFTIEIGARQIEEYIAVTWEISKCWLHCLDFLYMEELEYNTRYHYRVRWSIPTRRKPIPRATACTYFIIELSKVKPSHFPVEVYFYFESNKLMHRPNHSRFREKWLKNIIQNKILLMETVTF
ncbi:A-kinase anchor protein 14 isoform X2 [Callorhinchus milii]|uniref:A-kinase anchor protein 14-like protein n=1 Tax=Callorhinchus milii TaxID=7868 RepID=V9LFK0_CALMI|nr:A-kinase anchor protein 14 isoform X2 [Callorhinchus milii]